MPTDDKQLYIVRRNLSGGMNNREHGSNIPDSQATLLKNIDITVPGETKKRPGLSLVEDLGNDVGYGLFGFEPSGGTNELIAVEDTSLHGWQGAGSFTEHKSNFTAGSVCKMLKIGEESEDDVLVVYINGNNWFRMLQDNTFQDLGSTTGTGSDSPPRSEAAAYFRQRWWILKDDRLYYSAPFSADYSSAFDDVADWYRTTVGTERALIPLRDLGLIILGEDAVEAINPSTTPDATDKVERLIDIGCVASKTAVQVGDDILFLAKDGVRGLFRTQQDKLQMGESYPLSFPLKSQTDNLSWGYISKASAVYFDNKYFISVPVDGSTYNNQVWVYYPALKAWVIISGWNVADWAKMRVDGEEKLYAIDSNDGAVYQAWTGYDDNGVAIDYDEQGRKEDFGQPLVSKVGGELKVRAFASGDYDLTIQASADDRDWVTLGTLNVAGDAPTLPVVLPFTLADINLVEGIFHLDVLGAFRQLRIRIRHNNTNGSDDIKIFERSIVTYGDEYQSE